MDGPELLSVQAGALFVKWLRPSVNTTLGAVSTRQAPRKSLAEELVSKNQRSIWQNGFR